MVKIKAETTELLDRMVECLNVPEFADSDPVGYVRQFSDERDIEIASLLCSTIAWGNRKMICRDCEKMLDWMDWQPYNYMRDGAFERLDGDVNVHRTFFVRNLQYYLRGLRAMYAKHGTLQSYAQKILVPANEAKPWMLAEALRNELAEANDLADDPRCLPGNFATTALKRFNMALRWLVRNDGKVDLGIWDVIKPSELYIPLDVHVARTARELGLLNRRSNDRKAVTELTGALAELRPQDPVAYDFALFGIGMGL